MQTGLASRALGSTADGWPLSGERQLLAPPEGIEAVIHERVAAYG